MRLEAVTLDVLLPQSSPVSVKLNKPFSQIEVAQNSASNPTLGFFPGSGSEKAHFVYINGYRLDLRICNDIKTLRQLVAAGRHREASGQQLPGGYMSLYPEEVEDWVPYMQFRSLAENKPQPEQTSKKYMQKILTPRTDFDQT